ncbi:P-loop containing nucleoside triphosphate hydrolase protein [Aspergillus stella-maris]|uniref:P-loop containing nucleoside triphosphate hydrolase protein n=1 Tax=Aspergillus stella-maris TaxID=1810926 RepID=UPI003CCD59F5
MGSQLTVQVQDGDAEEHSMYFTKRKTSATPEEESPVKSAEDSAEGSNEEATGASEPTTSNVLYIAKFLLPDKSGEWKLESEKAFHDRPTVATRDRGLPNPVSSVLEEHRELSCNDDDSSLPLLKRVNHAGLPVLYVLSPILLNALKALITFQSAPDCLERREHKAEDIETSLENGWFVYPFRDLYYHQERLRQYREGVKESHDEEYSETCRQHLDILLGYLDDHATTLLKGVTSMLSHAAPRITSRCLWYLFKPGSNVYVRENGKLNAYVVESSRYATGHSWDSPQASPAAYRVYVWNLHFDGRHLSRSVDCFSIPVFSGKREIRSLPVFPVEFHDDETLRQQLIDRGKKFVEMMKQPAFREYNGPSKLQGIKKFNRERVVVDHTAEPWNLDGIKNHSSEEVYFPITTVSGIKLGEDARIAKCPCQKCEDKEAQRRGLQRCTFDDYDQIDLQQKATLTDHQYMICPSHVYGVLLKDFVWDILEVEHLEQPNIQANLIDMLAMKDEDNKEMIKAMCEMYGGSYKQTLSSDFVQGKGEGQIVLLHGPPGTGKTLTAESVAEYTSRPLISITAADLGYKPQELETRLRTYCRFAQKWNAIVLLDNSDDFLEASDDQRSHLTAFIRALDYFQGILFLTTNRVGRFDKAIISRIHIRIGFDPLDEGSRQQIWNNHFRRLSRNHETHGHEIRVSSDAKEFVRKSTALQALKWNGHEIRNAFKTALALACSQAKHKQDCVINLTDEHLRKVVNMSQNFKVYLDREYAWVEYIYV